MKKLQAFIAADGSLHKSPTDAAVADLVAMGMSRADAELVLERSKEIMALLLQIEHPYTIAPHYEPVATEVEAA